MLNTRYTRLLVAIFLGIGLIVILKNIKSTNQLFDISSMVEPTMDKPDLNGMVAEVPIQENALGEGQPIMENAAVGGAPPIGAVDAAPADAAAAQVGAEAAEAAAAPAAGEAAAPGAAAAAPAGAAEAAAAQL